MGVRIGRRIMGLTVALLLYGAVSSWAAATMENPVPGSLKSGVGVISGWACDADELEVSFDGGPRTFVPYGSERVDTTGVCGDTDNGFGLLWNYNELGDGPHTVTLYVDGVVQTQVNFNVTTLGTNFLRGVTGQGTITLSDGKNVNVQWEETTQGFTITGYADGDETNGTEATNSEVLLNRMRGTWRFYYSDGPYDGHYFSPPADDIYDEWVFSDIEIRYGVPVLVGDYTGLDRIEWVIVALTRDFPLVQGTSWVEEYKYVAFYEDVYDDDFGNLCEFILFGFGSSTRVWGHATRAVLFDDGMCGSIGNVPGGAVSGFRVQGPQ